MSPSRSPGSGICGSPARKERKDEYHTPKKILIKTFNKKSVGNRYAIKLLMVVFVRPHWGVCWTMLSNDEYLGHL